MKEKILEETLVTNSTDCYRLAIHVYRKHVKIHSKDQAAKNIQHGLVSKGAISMTTHLKQVKETTSDQTSQLIRLGGINASCKLSVVYDLANACSMHYPDLPEQINNHCSLTLNGYIYCIGGFQTSKFMIGVNDALRLNTKMQNSGWEQVASMNKKRYSMGAAVYGDVIVVAGGVDETYREVASTEVYQPSFNEWRTISPLKQQRYAHALVSCDGYLYAIGGWGDYNLSSVERLGDLKGEWINIEPMQTPRRCLAAVNCDGVVYAIGGRFHYKSSTTLKNCGKI